VSYGEHGLSRTYGTYPYSLCIIILFTRNGEKMKQFSFETFMWLVIVAIVLAGVMTVIGGMG
jgi:hypothetical protein